MKELFKNICKVMIYVSVGGYALSKAFNKFEDGIIFRNSYEGAIQAINESDMWSSDKLKAISLIKKNKTPDTYIAIISIVNGNMWSSDKLKAIENMFKESE